MALHSELVHDYRFRQAFDKVTIFGVAGSNGSGKDTVMSVLADSGYFVFNTGDNLRQLTKATMGTTQRGGNHSPTGTIANAQRSTYPGGMVSLGLVDYWARVLHMQHNLWPKGLAIGSIRAVGEVEALKKFGGKLIVVDADPKIRYKRIVSRARDYESKISYERFISEDEAEMGADETDSTKFGLAKVLKMGDINLGNSEGGIDEFVGKVKKELGLDNG